MIMPYRLPSDKVPTKNKKGIDRMSKFQGSLIAGLLSLVAAVSTDAADLKAPQKTDAKKCFEKGGVPTGWTSSPADRLAISTDNKKSGTASLFWKLDWQQYPESEWDDPNHQKARRLGWWSDDVISYFNENVLECKLPSGVATKKTSGVSLTFMTMSIRKTNRNGGTFARKTYVKLDLMNGDKVLATGWFHESQTWRELKMPYKLAKGAKVTGIRITTPMCGSPLWGEYDPNACFIDDANFDSGSDEYNGIMIEDFENGNAVPASWTADSKGKAELSSVRALSGTRSLLWSWKAPGASLSYAQKESIGKGIMGFFVYNEKPSDAKLKLEFMDNGTVRSSCWYLLNFKGWHVFAAPLNKLPIGQSKQFRFVAPEGMDAGRLWIDFLNLDAWGSRAGCYRPEAPVADFQQPWLAQPALVSLGAGNQDQLQRLPCSKDDLSSGRPWLPALVPSDKITAEQMDFIATHQVKDAEIPSFPAGAKKGVFDRGRLEFLEREVARYGITERDGVLNGKPLDLRFNVPPSAINWGRDYAWSLTNCILAYWQSVRKGDDEAAQKLLSMTTLLLRYYIDQGYTSQSDNYFTFYFVTDPTKEILDMKNVLPKDVYEEMASLSFFQSSNGGSLYKEYPSGDTDVIQVSYHRYIKNLCKAGSPSQCLQQIQTFRRAVNLICGRLDTEPFGPDGTCFHHGLHHWCYAGYEFANFIRFIRYFHGSCFQLDKECYDICKKFIFTMAWSFCKYTMPSSLLARPGNVCRSNMAGMAGEMAEIGTPDGQPFDRDLASLFLALTDKPDSEQAKKYRDMGVEPYKFDGHRVVNGAATSIQRRDDWMVGIIGMNKHVGGLEIYGGPLNSYSSFARNGSVSVVSSGSPTSCEASGWSFDGWDSRHYPGCTNRLCKPQELWASHKGVANGSAFAGGTDLDGDGIWGFALQAEGVDARKSAFCFGRRVTLLTTDVKQTDKGTEPLVTTLYQNAFAGDPASEPCFIDGMEAKSFPAEQALSGDAPHWLLDNKGTGYYVHAGSAPLKALRRQQKWFYIWPEYLLDKTADPMRIEAGETASEQSFGTKKVRSMTDADIEKYYKPTVNNFALAYFEHGEKTDAEGCAYTMLIRTTPEEMRKFADEMGDRSYRPNRTDRPYEILQRDSQAHILWDRETKTTGYVIFDQAWRPEKGAGVRVQSSSGKQAHESALSKPRTLNPEPFCLLSVSRPCLVMVKELGGKLKLSVASTDWKNKSPMILSLRGAWSMDSTDTAQPCKAEPQNGSTSVEINYEFEKPTMGYMPIHMTFKERKRQ